MDKPHKLLPRQLRKVQASRAIHKIRSENGNILTDAKAINKGFADFHSKVYKSKGEIDIKALNQFLASTNLPTLSEETSDLDWKAKLLWKKLRK